MAVNPSPFGPKPQFELSSGVPAVGNKLFFYVAGSVNTKQNTYTSSTGLTPNTNAIILDALGMPTNTEIWFTAGLSYKVVYAPSTDTDPPTSPIWTIDNIRGINDTTVSQDQWISYGGAPTFVSGTSFTLVGDQTTAFHPGRRLKSTNSGGTIYSTIVSSAFAAVTTVTVVNDSSPLDAGLSAVSYGLLTADNPSTPLLADSFPIVSGSSDKTKKLRLEVDGNTTATTRVATPPDYDFRIMSQTHGADIASATGAGTLNLDTATGDLVDVTGTTGITAITLAEGKTATVRFTGILTLTNGASLVLPGAMNITTVAGDVGIFRGYAAGVVRCVNFQPISSGPTPSGTKLASGSVSAATLDIVMTSYTAFANKLLVFDVVPSTDATTLSMQVSTDGGSTYLAGTGYNDEMNFHDDNGSNLMQVATGTAQIRLSFVTNVGNGSNEGISGSVVMYNTTSSAKWPRFGFETVWVSADGTPRFCQADGGGMYRAAQDTDAVRFAFSSGNIVGSWTLYGNN